MIWSSISLNLKVFIYIDKNIDKYNLIVRAKYYGLIMVEGKCYLSDCFYTSDKWKRPDVIYRILK